MSGMELAIDKLCKTFGSITALDGVSAVLRPGVTGLVGPNGSGKTTLLRTLATTISPTGGTLSWNGLDAIRYPDRLRRDLVYMPQNFAGYPRLTAREFLRYLSELRGVPTKAARASADAALACVGLEREAKRQIATFTPGMTQRLGMGYVLQSDASIVLLDEPTAGLDPYARSLLCDALMQMAKDRIVVICTHIFDDLELVADRVLALNAGRLVAFNGRAEFIDHARDHVWEVRSTAYPHLDAGRVTGQRREAGDIVVRFVAATAPTPDALRVPPRLHDACAWLEFSGGAA